MSEDLQQDDGALEQVEAQGDTGASPAAVDTASADPFESTARAGGWVPQEEWRGPPDKWKPAKQFVEDGDRFAGILKKERDELKAERAKMAKTIEAQKSFIEFQKKQLDAREDELKAQKREAVQLGDADAVDRLDAAIDGVREQKASLPDVQVPTTPVPPSQEIQEWGARNADWFDKDPAKTRAAVAIGQQLRRENPGISEGAFVRLLDAELQSAGITGGARKAPAAAGLDDGSRGGGGAASGEAVVVDGKRVTYASLPPDAKQACDMFIEQGFVKDRAEYLKLYAETSK